MQKALAWIGLAIGGGGTLLFAWAITIEGQLSESNRWLLAWPFGTALLAGFCCWLLRRAYCLEPVRGSVQLALVDLISALTIFGSVLYIGSHAVEGTELLRYWLVPSLVIASSYLAGVTRAARLGMRSWRRYATGTATAMTIIGGLGTGALGVFMLFVTWLYEGGAYMCAYWVAVILDAERDVSSAHWLIYTFRISLCALPLGLLLGLALRLTAHADRPPASDAPKGPREFF